MMRLPLQQQEEEDKMHNHCTLVYSDVEERDSVIRRLPASIQAMLLKADHFLSTQEIEILSGATADHRCEALRMFFEGKSADEAVSFLLNVSSHKEVSEEKIRKSIKTTPMDPPTRAATMNSVSETIIINKGDSPSPTISTSSNIKNSSSSPVSDGLDTTQCLDPGRPTCPKRGDSSEAPSPLRIVPIPRPRERTAASFDKPSYILQKNYSSPLGEVTVNTATNPINSTGTKTTTSTRKLLEFNEVKTAGNSSNRTTPNISHKSSKDLNKKNDKNSITAHVYAIPRKCPAFDDEYYTYIVHPKRLKELEMQKVTPEVVRPGTINSFRRQLTSEKCKFSRQNISSVTHYTSASVFSRQVSIGVSASGALHSSRTHSTFHSLYNEQTPSTPRVPPLKNIKKKRRQEDVFMRLYSASTTSCSPLPVTARLQTPSRSTPRLTTPRSARVQRNPLPLPSSSSSSFFSKKLSEAPLTQTRGKISTAIPLSRCDTTTRIHRTVTVTNYDYDNNKKNKNNNINPQYARTRTWSSRREV